MYMVLCFLEAFDVNVEEWMEEEPAELPIILHANQIVNSFSEMELPCLWNFNSKRRRVYVYPIYVQCHAAVCIHKMLMEFMLGANECGDR